MEGYIKIYRSLLDWEWYSDTNTFRLFMHILLNANHSERNYRGVTIPAGGCVFAYSSFAKQLKMSVKEVRTAMAHLKSTGEVRMQRASNFSVVIVENWGFWQGCDVEKGKQRASKGQAKRQAKGKQNGKQTASCIPCNERLSAHVEDGKGQASGKQRAGETTTSEEYIYIYNTIPTIEEVKQYIRDNKLNVDAEYFYEYYNSRNWMKINGKPVENWKLTIRTWHKREAKGNDDRGSGKQSRNIRGTASGSRRDNEYVETGFIPMAAGFSSEE